MAEEAAATAEAATAEATSATEATATGKTFSQEELNAIVQDRLARAAKGQPSKDELAELQKAKADLDKIQEAGASELEKANKAREAAEVKATAALATANDRLLKSEAVTALVAAGVTSVDAAFRALEV
jgi:hypothetical protein